MSPNAPIHHEDNNQGSYPPISLFQHCIWILLSTSPTLSSTSLDSNPTSSHAHYSSLVESLSERYPPSPRFQQHITLFSGLKVDEELEGAVEDEGQVKRIEGLKVKVEEFVNAWKEEIRREDQKDQAGESIAEGSKTDLSITLQLGDPIALDTYHTSLVQPVMDPRNTFEIRTVTTNSASDKPGYDLLLSGHHLARTHLSSYLQSSRLPPTPTDHITPSKSFFPHLSLQYTSLPLATRQAIARELVEKKEVLKEVKVGGVGLMRCVGEAGEWKEVSRWEI